MLSRFIRSGRGLSRTCYNYRVYKPSTIAAQKYFSTESEDPPDPPAAAAAEPEQSKTLATSNAFSDHPGLANIEIPKLFPNVPCIAVNRNPIFPNFVKMVEVHNPQLQNIIRQRIALGKPYVGVFLKKNEEHTGDTIEKLEDIYNVGSFCQVTEFREIEGKLRLVLLGHRRIEIKNVAVPDAIKGQEQEEVAVVEGAEAETLTEGENSEELTVEQILQVETDNVLDHKFVRNDEVKALTGEIFATFRDIIRLNSLYKDSIQSMLDTGTQLIDNSPYLADLGAGLTGADGPELQKVLEERDIPKRLHLTLEMLKKEHAMVLLQKRLSQEVEEKVNKIQRKFMLNEQLKIIKKELGIEKDDKEAVVDKFRDRLKEKNIPDNISEVIEEEIKKLQYLDSHSSEFSVTRNYLDWLTILPWGLQSEECLDIAKAKEILEADHYGLTDIKERILEFIAVSKLKGSVKGKIICFTGPPGVGKTSIARSIARSLNREYFRFSVGGMSDVAEIKGHRRTYVGAMPGKIIQCMKKTQTENPLVLIDEVDKMSKGHQGDPASALLELLDPEQNVNFLDHYLDVPVDLSKALFICTANVTDTIPGPLLDRMEVINVSGYIAEEKLAIAQQYLSPASKNECGISDDNLSIGDEAILSLIKGYCRESGVRSLQKHIEQIYRKSAMKIVTQPDIMIEVTPDNLTDFVGKPKFLNQRLYETTPPGVVMGLAWTAMGGTQLYIETVQVGSSSDKKGKGAAAGTLSITGQLGDVMTESAKIAHTVAKAYLMKLDKKNNFFQKADIHLHVPEGATPKDGPSAGITIVTALLSLATDTPVKANVAMTGEVSLNGKVLAVGGIKEKIIAAQRAGVQTIILPATCKRDYDDVPDFIRAAIEVHFVEHYSEVFPLVFESEKFEKVAAAS